MPLRWTAPILARRNLLQQLEFGQYGGTDPGLQPEFVPVTGPQLSHKSLEPSRGNRGSHRSKSGNAGSAVPNQSVESPSHSCNVDQSRLAIRLPATTATRHRSAAV